MFASMRADLTAGCQCARAGLRRCVIKAGATPFAASPYLTKAPGRPSPKVNTTLYCFALKALPFVSLDKVSPGLPRIAAGISN
jgi:hypothetical protein